MFACSTAGKSAPASPADPGQAMSNVMKTAVAATVLSVVAVSVLSSRKLVRPAAPTTPAVAATAPQPASQPERAQPVGGTAVLEQGANGHYFAKVESRGVTLNMLVDTGASVVALKAEDARALGFYPAQHEYTVRIMTANGEGRAAPVKLDMVRIGGLMVYDVPAIIAQPGAQSVSLLGMSFLKKLSSYSAERGRLVLRQ